MIGAASTGQSRSTATPGRACPSAMGGNSTFGVRFGYEMVRGRPPARLRMSLMPGLAARILLLCLLLGAAGRGAAQEAPRLLPLPRSMVVLPGRLTVSAATPIVADGPARSAALRFIDLVRRTSGIAPRLRPRAAGSAIRFRTIAGMAPESYRLEVRASGATIAASDAAGLFYGGVTLWQLLTEAPPPNPGRLTAQAVRIEDAPRFP